VLFDLGYVSTLEPFMKLQHVGLIMGEDGRKMSKRYGNVINPDDVVKTFGADALRLYEMFMGPFDQQISWSTDSIVGTRRFIERVWKLSGKVSMTDSREVFGGRRGRETGAASAEADTGSLEAVSETSRIVNKAIKKVTDDIQALRFNTAVSTMMITMNELEKSPSIDRSSYEKLLQLIAPFAPHAAEELWSQLGNNKSIHTSSWPTYDASLASETEVTIIVQVNGKMRGSFTAPAGTAKDELLRRARALPEAAKWLEGKLVKKEIAVPDRLVNLVV
jgi:leucyl-tRNA synthetase